MPISTVARRESAAVRGGSSGLCLYITSALLLCPSMRVLGAPGALVGTGLRRLAASGRSSTTAGRSTSLTAAKTGIASAAPNSEVTSASRTISVLTSASTPVPIWIAAKAAKPSSVMPPPSTGIAPIWGRPTLSR